ncbi:MAG TPA: TonB family protein [Acidobacteria bacterium]|nr:TonB family protein [Acidobacteriota bacterium]
MTVRQPVLVVDFDKRSLATTRKRLEDAGIACRWAGNAVELDAQLQAGAPPVVVIDPMLPGKDGFKLCRQLKTSSNGPPTVIIFSRIFKGQRYRAMARDAGADLFLERPRDDQRLVEEIQQRLANLRDRESRLDPRTAATGLSTPAAGDPALADVTDDEIESALERALGTALVESAVPAQPAPSPAPPAVTAAPAEVPAPAAAPEPTAASESTVNPADLWASLDRLELEVAEELAPTRPHLPTSVTAAQPRPEEAAPARARTLDSPMAFDPVEEVQPSATVAATPPASVTVAPPAPAVPAPPVADSQAIESVVDSVIAFAPTVETGPAAEPARADAGAAAPAEIDGFAVVAEPPDSTASVESEVPEPLRGMDAGTAELLSTLEELEDSLPPEFEAGLTGDSGWIGTDGLSGTAGQGAPPAPSREEESSLEDLLDHLAAECPEPSAPPVAEVPHSGEHAGATEAGASGAVQADPPSRVLSGMMLLSFAIGIVLTGAVGGYYLSHRPEPPVQRALIPVTWGHAGDGQVPMVAGGAEVPDDAPTMRRVPESAQPLPPAREPVARASTPPKPPDAAAVPTAPKTAQAARLVASTPPRQPRPATPEARPAETEPRPATPEPRPAVTHGTSQPAPAMAAEVTTTPATETVAPASRREPAPAAQTSAPGEQAPPPPQPATAVTPRSARPQPTTRLEAPPEPPAAPDPLEPPAPLVRLGDLDYPLRLLETSRPPLTPEAREAEVQGRVFLSVLVGPNGRVKDARVMIEPGHGLGRAAATAVQSWRYSPPRSKGKRVRVWKTEVVEFSNEP